MTPVRDSHPTPFHAASGPLKTCSSWLGSIWFQQATEAEWLAESKWMGDIMKDEVHLVLFFNCTCVVRWRQLDWVTCMLKCGYRTALAVAMRQWSVHVFRHQFDSMSAWWEGGVHLFWVSELRTWHVEVSLERGHGLHKGVVIDHGRQFFISYL